MRKNRIVSRIFTCLFVALAAVSVLAADTATVRLVLDEESVLPGTPTGLSVYVSSARTLDLPQKLWILATNEAGETFTLRAQPTSDGLGADVPEEMRRVSAGRTRELRFDPTPVVAGSPWLTDDRLLPGRYTLRAVLAPNVEPDGTYDFGGALVSGEVALRVATESEEDAAVWQWMQEQGGGRWGDRAWIAPRADFARYVMNEHPESHYALFAAPFLPMRGHGEPNPVVEEQARRYPKKAFSEQLKTLLIQYHVQALRTARQRADAVRVQAESNAIRALATELAQTGRSSLVRAQAKEILASPVNRAQ